MLKSKEFFETLLINHPVRGRIPFKLRSFQEKLIDMVLNEQVNFFLKARQLGFTTTFNALAYWMAVSATSPKKILIMTNSATTGKQWLKRIKSWNNDSKIPLSKLVVSHENYVKFANGSTIRVTTPNCVCGETVDVIILDEFAYYKGLIANLTAVWPTLAPDGKIIAFTSAPHSTEEKNLKEFSEFWKNLKKNELVNTAEFPWYVDETKDYAWYKEQANCMGKNSSKQELECKF